MSDARRRDLEDRLDAYFATRRSPPSKDDLKHRLGRWPLYAAVTGSLAIAGNSSGSGVGPGIQGVTATPSQVSTEQPFTSSQNEPLIRSVKLAMARRNSARFSRIAPIVQAMQAPRRFHVAAWFQYTARSM
jgi:hypothetical protein